MIARAGSIYRVNRSQWMCAEKPIRFRKADVVRTTPNTVIVRTVHPLHPASVVPVEVEITKAQVAEK